MEERLHLSFKPLGRIRDTAQAGHPARKPQGLWWSCGTGFLDLVATSVRPAHRRFRGRQHVHSISLAPDPHLLVLSTPEALLAFTRTFGRPVPYADRPGLPRDSCIDWAAVAATHDGVEITDLCRDRRRWLEWLDLDWDTPSGCVWRSRAVHSVSPVKG